ncbi:RHO1 GDP-GTP exchange protein 2 [Microbotryomycetes sp. JL221]|nr:RHO1 GDP-GTP exchange protein 2 [Microbotryomycetes sp. JL221]
MSHPLQGRSSRAEAFDNIFRRPPAGPSTGQQYSQQQQPSSNLYGPSNVYAQQQQAYAPGPSSSYHPHQQLQQPHSPRPGLTVTTSTGSSTTITSSHPQPYAYHPPLPSWQQHDMDDGRRHDQAYMYTHGAQDSISSITSSLSSSSHPTPSSTNQHAPWGTTAYDESIRHPTALASPRSSFASTSTSTTNLSSGPNSNYPQWSTSSRPSVSSITSLSHGMHGAHLSEFAQHRHSFNSTEDEFFGSSGSRAVPPLTGGNGTSVDIGQSTFKDTWHVAPTTPTLARPVSRGGSPGSLFDPGPYDDSDRHSWANGSASNHIATADRAQTRGFEPRPLAQIHPVQTSYGPYGPNSNSPAPSLGSIHPRRSSESMRVLPTQPKHANYSQDRAFSFTSGERPDMRNMDSTFSRSDVAQSSNAVARRSPVVYPALLSRVAEAFRTRIALSERVKDGLVYPDCFDGRDAVDRIAYIIKTTDRNLALLLGRALDAQKFFHDVTYDHRLRDSPFELYQFRERLTGSFMSPDDVPYSAGGVVQNQLAFPARPGSFTDTVVSGEDSVPSGVFTLLTDCYSPTCSRDRLCYSIACPRRLEQQARLNLKPKPGLQRTVSTESLEDLREPGSLWIHSVPKEVVESTSDKEKKRQEALNEVFYTERDFVRDLEYLRDCWIKPLRTTNIIAEDRREDFVTQVFWNVLEIHSVNVRLVELLNKRQKSAHVVDKIGDIFLDVVPHFAPFVKYGAHQLYGKYEFEKEKGSNPAFARFVEETERLPESRKLELNGYLTKPTTRLARYPLLLEACLKHTPDDSPDKHILPKVIALVREFLNKVNVESGKSENRFNLAQLDQQLVFKNGEAVDLRLRDDDREMIYKGPLKKRGGTQSESAELQVFLFDHAVLMVKQKSKNEQYKVYRKPIPLELLVVAPIDDAAQARAGTVRPKSLAGRGAVIKYAANPPPGVDKNSKQGFAMTFIHLGRRGYQITLWAASWSGRKKWLDKIEHRQNELRERSLIFETLPLSAGYFVGTNRVTCAAPFDNGNRMVYGTDNGVYLDDLRDQNKVPVKVISVPTVTQLDVLEEQGILIVLADKAVQTFYVDHLDPGDAIGAAKRARKISSHATFFKAGQCLGRTLVCVVKSGSVSSTIKTLEPVDQVRGKKQPAIRKFLQGSNESLRVFKEFYIPTESSSVHFLKSKLCVGCTKGFEIVDLETLDTQGLLDPADSSLDFVQRRENARPIAIYRIDGDFLLCYDEFAFYVNKNGWRARQNWLIQWEGFPTTFAMHYPYVLAFEPTFIEVRHVETGALMQVIPGNNIKCLFADSPPSASSAAYYSSGGTSLYGYRGSGSSSRNQRYLDTLRGCPARWKVLVVDQYTQRMLNTVLTTYDILDQGVQQVDLITSARHAQPRLAAIYLLMPTSHNVQLILEDFRGRDLAASTNAAHPSAASGLSKLTNKKKDGSSATVATSSAGDPRYASAYLHFVDGIDDRLVEKLTSVLPDNYLQALKELYTNFQDRNARDSVPRWEDDIAWMSRALVNALATLGEYPHIRYYNPPSSFHEPLGPGAAVGEHICKRLAERVQREIDAYARDNGDFPGADEEKEAVLDEDDKVWAEVRHMHMKDALDKLIADFRSYAGEHGSKFGGSGGTSLNDMKDMLASLPQLREVKEKLIAYPETDFEIQLSLHLTMAEKCMSIFERKKLPLVASVEQVSQDAMNAPSCSSIIDKHAGRVVLRDWPHARREAAKDFSGGNGAAAGRPVD